MSLGWQGSAFRRSIFFSLLLSWLLKPPDYLLALSLFLPRVAPLSSQNVMVHHGQTQEYVLQPKYFPAPKVVPGEQSTEGAFSLRYGQDQGPAPFQGEYLRRQPFSWIRVSEFGNISLGLDSCNVSQ